MASTVEKGHRKPSEHFIPGNSNINKVKITPTTLLKYENSGKTLKKTATFKIIAQHN